MRLDRSGGRSIIFWVFDGSLIDQRHTRDSEWGIGFVALNNIRGSSIARRGAIAVVVEAVGSAVVVHQCCAWWVVMVALGGVPEYVGCWDSGCIKWRIEGIVMVGQWRKAIVGSKRTIGIICCCFIG